jgi:hypothetical protein
MLIIAVVLSYKVVLRVQRNVFYGSYLGSIYYEIINIRQQGAKIYEKIIMPHFKNKCGINCAKTVKKFQSLKLEYGSPAGFSPAKL